MRFPADLSSRILFAAAFAGLSLRANEASKGPAPLDHILYGAAYYEEYMPAERLTEDVRLMKDAGLNVVRIGESTWSVMEPQDGVFDFSHLDHVLNAMHGAGIQVIVGTPTYSVPTWLARKCPKALMNGWDSYGYRQNMDITDPGYRFYAERFIRAMVAHVKNHPAIIGFQIDNETKSYGTSGENVRAAFVEKMKTRFASLEEMNHAWNLNYWGQNINTWEDFPNPSAASNPGLKLEWNRFQRNLSTEFLAWECKIVRELKRPDQFLTHNFDGDHDAPNWQVNHFDAAKNFDTAGIDVYYPSQNSFNGASIAFFGDYARSFLGKNHLVLETTAQTCGWDSKYQYPPLDGQVRQAFYSHLASGANMVEYWHWHSLHNGQETYWRGVLGQDLEPNRVYAEVKRTGNEVKAISKHLVNLHITNKVAVLYSGDSHNALRIQPFSDKDDYGTVLRGMYDALYRLNVGADIVVPESDWSAYRVLVVPPLYVASDALCQKLIDFAARGGHIVFSFKTAYCDENSQVRHVKAPGPLAKICGLTYQEFSNTGPVPLNSAISTSVSKGESSTWVEFLKVDTAKPLYSYDHSFFAPYPAVTVNNYGTGQVVYQGTLLAPATQEAVFQHVLRNAGLWGAAQEYASPVVVRSGVNEAGKTVYYIFNYSASAVTVPYRFGKGTDLLTSKTVTKDSSLEIAPWDLAIVEEN